MCFFIYAEPGVTEPYTTSWTFVSDRDDEHSKTVRTVEVRD